MQKVVLNKILALYDQVASISDNFASLIILSLQILDGRNGSLYFPVLRTNAKNLDPIPGFSIVNQFIFLANINDYIRS